MPRGRHDRETQLTECLLAALGEQTSPSTSKELGAVMRAELVEPFPNSSVSALLKNLENRGLVIGHRKGHGRLVTWSLAGKERGDWRLWGYAPGYGPRSAFT